MVNGLPQIEIKVHSEDDLVDVECEIDLKKEHNILELEEKKEREIKRLMETAIRKAQKEYRTDVFGFGSAVHRADPKAWARLKTDWERTFSELPVHIEADVVIRRQGMVNQALPFEIKE